MKRYINFLVAITLLIVTMGSSFVKVRDFVTGKTIGKNIGNVFGDGFGAGFANGMGPVVERYDASNRENLKLFDKIISSNLDKFKVNLDSSLAKLDGMLEEREIQFDEILKTSIVDIDNRIKDNIELTDKILEERSNEFTANLTGLWGVIYSDGFNISKFILLGVVFIVLLNFFLKNNYQYFASNVDSKELKAILISLFNYVIIFSIIIGVAYFVPRPKNEEFENKIKNELVEIENDIYNLRYQEAYIKSLVLHRVLSQRKPEDTTFQLVRHYKDKYKFLSDLFYRPRAQALNKETDLEILLSRVKGIFDAAKEHNINDPELYIIAGLVYSKIFTNTEGEMIGGIFSNIYFKERGKKVYPLEVYAYDMLSNFRMTNYPKYMIDSVCTKFGIKNNGWVNIDTLQTSSYKNYSLFMYNKLVREHVLADEIEFIKFLEAKKEQNIEKVIQIGIKFVKRWEEFEKNISKISNNNEEILSKMLTLNDSYLRYVETILITMKYVDEEDSTRRLFIEWDDKKERYITGPIELIKYWNDVNLLVDQSISMRAKRIREMIKPNLTFFKKTIFCKYTLSVGNQTKNMILEKLIYGPNYARFKKVVDFSEKWIANGEEVTKIRFRGLKTRIIKDIIDNNEFISAYVAENRIRDQNRELVIKKTDLNQSIIDKIYNSSNKY